MPFSHFNANARPAELEVMGDGPEGSISMKRLSDVRRWPCLVAFAFVLAAMPGPAWAQSSGTDSPEDLSTQPGWSAGPTFGNLGTRAVITVPEGYMFLDQSATRRLLERNQNVPDGDELGAVLRLNGDDYWFAVFSYSDEGHVDDTDRDSIDAAALMKKMIEGAKHANEARRERGWSAVNLEGWHRQPYYDPATNNLTWATRLSSEGGSPGINHSVRLLGRTGVMSVQLVADAETIESSTAEFNEALGGFTFNVGQKYAEFRKGDKLAGYGLAALIGGGVAATAIKTGFLQKFWKLLVFGAIAVLGGLKKLLAMLTGRGAESSSDNSGVPPIPTR
jgi:uncharacterized membrane-anchored protein